MAAIERNRTTKVSLETTLDKIKELLHELDNPSVVLLAGCYQRDENDRIISAKNTAMIDVTHPVELALMLKTLLDSSNSLYGEEATEASLAMALALLKKEKENV